MTIKQNTIKANGSAEHAEKKRKLRDVWYQMKYRCYYPNNKDYKDCGALGITICPEWLENKDVFIAWGLANGYSFGLTIERVNDSAGYCPENCKFVTRTEQALNRRMSKKNKSGITGVSWNKRDLIYQAIINVAGKQYNIGTFDCIIEAAAALNQYKIDNDFSHKLHTFTGDEAPCHCPRHRSPALAAGV